MIRLEESASGPALVERLTEMLKANWRLGLLAIGLFVGAFASMSYASRNHSVPRATPATAAKPEVQVAMAAPTLPLRSEPRAGAIDLPASVKPDAAISPPVVKPAPKAAEPPEPVEKDPGRHRMRLTAIQAANAYTQSPCDPAAKAAFIVATATYLQAAKMNADVFSWRDTRVRAAVQAAFQAGGISKDEFPIGAQPGVATLAAPHGELASPCGRRADNTQP
jgi:hypothetical protein